MSSEPSSARVRAVEEAAIDEALGRSLPPGDARAEEVGRFFKSVAAVSRAEDALVGQHREAVDAEELLLGQERAMLDDLKQPHGASVDEYAAGLQKVLDAKGRILAEMQRRLDALRDMMAKEEALSARVKQVPLY